MIQTNHVLNRGSYMSAHVLLNSLNEMRKRDKMRGLQIKNLSSGVCEQQRRRPACPSAQSDQRLCYSLIGKYHI